MCSARHRFGQRRGAKGGKTCAGKSSFLPGHLFHVLPPRSDTPDSRGLQTLVAVLVQKTKAPSLKAMVGSGPEHLRMRVAAKGTWQKCSHRDAGKNRCVCKLDLAWARRPQLRLPSYVSQKVWTLGRMCESHARLLALQCSFAGTAAFLLPRQDADVYTASLAHFTNPGLSA